MLQQYSNSARRPNFEGNLKYVSKKLDPNQLKIGEKKHPLLRSTYWYEFSLMMDKVESLPGIWEETFQRNNDIRQVQGEPCKLEMKWPFSGFDSKQKNDVHKTDG